MTTRTTRFPLLRGGALAAVAASAILAACESRLPTAAEVEKMDVAAVEQRVLFESGTEYYVDGVRTTPEQARNLAPDAIRSVRALKASVKAGVDPSSVPSRIEISTMRAGLPSKTPLRASGARDGSRSPPTSRPRSGTPTR